MPGRLRLFSYSGNTHSIGRMIEPGYHDVVNLS
jgi:hypothetical protein